MTAKSSVVDAREGSFSSAWSIILSALHGKVKWELKGFHS